MKPIKDAAPQGQDSQGPSVDQQYTLLCAQFGERQYLISKLGAELQVLAKQIDEFKQKHSVQPK